MRTAASRILRALGLVVMAAVISAGCGGGSGEPPAEGTKERWLLEMQLICLENKAGFESRAAQRTTAGGSPEAIAAAFEAEAEHLTTAISQIEAAPRPEGEPTVDEYYRVQRELAEAIPGIVAGLKAGDSASMARLGELVVESNSKATAAGLPQECALVAPGG